jgi:hypothetical protein
VVSKQLELRQTEELVYDATETISLEKLIEQQKISECPGWLNPGPITRGLSLTEAWRCVRWLPDTGGRRYAFGGTEPDCAGARIDVARKLAHRASRFPAASSVLRSRIFKSPQYLGIRSI